MRWRAFLAAAVLLAACALLATGASGIGWVEFAWYWKGSAIYANPNASVVVVPVLNSSRIYVNGSDILTVVSEAANSTAYSVVLETTYTRQLLDSLLLGNISAVEHWVETYYYNRSSVDHIVAGNASAVMAWALASFYPRQAVDSIVAGNASSIEQWVEANYYNRSIVDRLVTGNASAVKRWVAMHYYNRSSVDALVAGNISAVKRWVETDYYNRSQVDAIVSGNASAVEQWVEANYYDKSTIDSWNLIKHYRLTQPLDAAGQPILDIGYVNDPFTVRASDGRYTRFFFGSLADIEVNATGLAIHPPWPNGYNPAYGFYVMNSSDGVRVGVRTDTPTAPLTVNGWELVAGHVVSAEVFSRYSSPTVSALCRALSFSAGVFTAGNFTPGYSRVFLYVASLPYYGPQVYMVRVYTDDVQHDVNVTYSSSTSTTPLLALSFTVYVEQQGGVEIWSHGPGTAYICILHYS